MVALGAAVLLGAGCGETGTDRAAESHAAVMQHSRATSPELGGQFRAAEALGLPALVGADATALRRLRRGSLPSATEVATEMGGMQAAGPMPTVVPADPTAAHRLAGDLAAAREVAARYPTARVARTDGYLLTSRFLPGIGAHWTQWSSVIRPFDAAHPSMLLFDGNGPDAHLAGLSYYVQSTTSPRAFTEGGAVWHRHIGLCIAHGVLVGEGMTRRSQCAHGRGDLLPGRDIWMLHVWVVAGYPNAWGTFAPLNPALCTQTAPCTP